MRVISSIIAMLVMGAIAIAAMLTLLGATIPGIIGVNGVFELYFRGLGPVVALAFALISLVLSIICIQKNNKLIVALIAIASVVMAAWPSIALWLELKGKYKDLGINLFTYTNVIHYSLYVMAILFIFLLLRKK